MLASCQISVKLWSFIRKAVREAQALERRRNRQKRTSGRTVPTVQQLNAITRGAVHSGLIAVLSKIDHSLQRNWDTMTIQQRQGVYNEVNLVDEHTFRRSLFALRTLLVDNGTYAVSLVYANILIGPCQAATSS